VEVHLGSHAALARLWGDLRAYSVLHIAAHGYVDGSRLARTGLALSEAGGEAGSRFTVADALELDLDAELVVLSACETARGHVRQGEGIQSMARAFLWAGARGVVASLWNVPDEEARRVMESFYRGLLAGGTPAAAALREAKRSLRRSASSLSGPRGVGGVGAATRQAVVPAGHPYAWAAFIHVGRYP
jgi:CHAT domain-containing protein